MPRFLRKFIRNEHGAVTVDWVVLTAAIVGLAVLISLAMQSGAVDLADKVATFMSSWAF
jgi:Flp pilus assembly pilin Flp